MDFTLGKTIPALCMKNPFQGITVLALLLLSLKARVIKENLCVAIHFSGLVWPLHEGVCGNSGCSGQMRVLRSPD